MYANVSNNLVRMWYESPPPPRVNFNQVGTEFDQARTNSAMTHVHGFDATTRWYEQSLETLEIGNMFGPTFGFKNSHNLQFKE
jgi:hypothetical protein